MPIDPELPVVVKSSVVAAKVCPANTIKNINQRNDSMTFHTPAPKILSLFAGNYVNNNSFLN